MNDFANLQITQTIWRFLDIARKTNCFQSSATRDEFVKLLRRFSMDDKDTLDKFMSYFCALWASGSVTVIELGYVETCTVEIKRLLP